MQFETAFFEHVRRQGGLLYARVIARDHLHLAPRRISRAAAARLRAGLRALEAWLRRVILLMALQIAPELTPDQSEYVKYRRAPRQSARARRFVILDAGRDFPGIDRALSNSAGDPLARGTPVPAAPYLARLSALKALIEAPEARARRLAFYLARHRPGRLLAPNARTLARLPARYGTEVSALYAGFAVAIPEASRARPPPLGPRPRARPRIRRL